LDHEVFDLQYIRLARLEICVWEIACVYILLDGICYPYSPVAVLEHSWFLRYSIDGSSLRSLVLRLRRAPS
jgi:hypothetical protein